MFRSDGLDAGLNGDRSLLLHVLGGTRPLGGVKVHELTHPISKPDLNVAVERSYRELLGREGGERQRGRERVGERRREGGWEGLREGEKERKREGEREGGSEGGRGRQGVGERGRVGRTERGREGKREREEGEWGREREGR